ncbi:SLATT domain-containing protein [[Clostridium] hylemonae]|uniref:SLATT domain-containing protein n=1 Tax=[Clostridium] hylemonae TaxID=89153 RepID=UPI001D05C413|nr:SLATT domain-containing protein [[Clostridium] hylemonae]MCB7523284.1 SLATT domain-containing protein [[Clostridium] hylemonae]
MEHVIKQLKQFKVDAIYGKKKNYNAASRKRRYYKITSTGQIILNAITGTTLLAVIFGEGNKIAEIIALLFTIVATVFAGVQKVQDFENQAQGNAKVGDMYLEISKLVNLLLCEIADDILSRDEILKRADEVRRSIDQANKMGSQFPTSDNDYQEARKGIEDGEERYKADELELWN